MWLLAITLWACAILVFYEIRFPLPLEEAREGLIESWRHSLPLLSWRGLVTFVGGVFGNLGAFGMFLLLQAAFLAAGLRTARWLGFPGGASPFGRFSCLLAGWTVAGILALGLGLAGLLRSLPLTVAALVFLLSAPGGPAGLVIQIRSMRLPVDGSKLAWLADRAAWLVLALAALAFLSPQTGADSLQYHLALPARGLELGKLVSQAGNFFLDLPCQVEMLFAFGLRLGGEGVARLTALAGLIAAAGLLGTLAASRVGARWGRAGFALAVTCPFLLALARDGKPDAIVVPFSFAALAWLVVPRLAVRGLSRSAFVAGAFAGAAAASKLAVLGVAFPALILLLVLSPAPGRLWRLGMFATGTCVILGPWLARAFLLTGDPIYPFGPGSFGMPAAAVEVYRSALRVMDLAGDYSSPLAGLVSVWTATFSDGLSPLWLACLPLALAALFQSSHSRAWWLAGAIAWTAWFLLAPQLRFAAPALAWLGTASLLAAGELAARRPAALRTLTVLAAAILFLQSARSVTETIGGGSLLAGMGLESRRSFFNRVRGPYARALDLVKRRTPEGSRVLMVGDRRAYPRTRALVVASPFEPPPVYSLIKASGTPEELARRMRQLRVSHVLHNHVMGYRFKDLKRAYDFSARDLSVWAAYWRRHARLVAVPRKVGVEDGGFYLYRLGKRRPELNVTPTLPGIGGAFGVVEEARRQGRLREVAERMRGLENIVGDFPEVMFFIGDFWSRETPYKSWDYFRRADGAGYRHLALWRELAYQAEEHWRLEEALKYHEKIYASEAKARGKRHKRVLVKLSRQAQKLSRPDKAEKHLRRAVVLFPSDPAVWAEFAELMVETKNGFAADGALVEALKLDPDNEEYREALSRLRR